MIVVRPYEHSDAAGVIEMWERLHAGDSAVAAPSREDWDRYALDNDGEKWFRVALVDENRIVGVMTALSTVEENARSIQILVEPAQRRRGIGRRLLEAAFDLDARSVMLETMCPGSWSHAEQFFLKNGFQVVEEELEMEAPTLQLPPPPLEEPARWKIRQATLSDAGVLSQIHEASFKHTLSYARFAPEWFLRRIGVKDESILVVEIDEEVVGYCLSEIENDGERVVIEDLAVAPDHRRTGMGRALLIAALRGASTAALRVDEDNHGAIALYRSLGFEETSRSRRFHGVPRAA